MPEKEKNQQLNFKDRLKNFLNKCSKKIIALTLIATIALSTAQGYINNQNNQLTLNKESLNTTKQYLQTNLLSAKQWIAESNELKKIFKEVPKYPILLMSTQQKDIFLINFQGQDGFIIADNQNYNNSYFIPFGSIDIKDLKGNSIDPAMIDFYTTQTLLNINFNNIKHASNMTDKIIEQVNYIISDLERIQFDRKQLKKNTMIDETHIQKLRHLENDINTFRHSGLFLSSFMFAKGDKVIIKNLDRHKIESRKKITENMNLKIKYDHLPQFIHISDFEKYGKDIVNQLNKQTGLKINFQSYIQTNVYDNKVFYNGYYLINEDKIQVGIAVPQYQQHLANNFSVPKEVFINTILHEYGHALYQKELLIMVMFRQMQYDVDNYLNPNNIHNKHDLNGFLNRS